MSPDPGRPRCRRCGESLAGWRCAHCGRPVRAFLGLLAGLPLLFAATTLGSFLPDRDLPLARDLPGGATEFVVQSMREALLIPAGALALAAFCAMISMLLAAGRGGDRTAGTGTAGEAPPPRPSRLRLGLAAAPALCGVLFLVLAAVPALSRFRRLVVRPGGIELCTLIGSRLLDPSEVVHLSVRRQLRPGGGPPERDLWVELTCTDGSVRRSVRRTVPAAEYGRWDDFLRRMVEEARVGRRAGGAVPGPDDYH
jgi:hypothetical protein